MNYTRVLRVAYQAGIAACIAAHRAYSQTVPPVFSEYRIDAIVDGGMAAEVGMGRQLALDYYVRLGLTGAVGASRRAGVTKTSGRVDVVARYLLDPFRELGWGFSLGGGVSAAYTDGDAHVHPYLTVVADLEGRRRRGISPAVQLGLGGGARIGLAFRTSKGQSR